MSRAFEKELGENRALWDEWAVVNAASAFYDVPRFRSDPNDVRVAPWERDEVGDVAGKTVLHIQCHFGLDTLSSRRWATASTTAGRRIRLASCR